MGARTCCRPLRIRYRHRLNRQWGSFQSPRLSGKSRQRLPVRWRGALRPPSCGCPPPLRRPNSPPRQAVLGAAPHSHYDDDSLHDAPSAVRFASQPSRNRWTAASCSSRCSTGLIWPASHHRVGPVGHAHARSLADSGLRIALVERQPRTTLKTCPFDGQEIALTHHSSDLYAA
jgi:hypothetical protein